MPTSTRHPHHAQMFEIWNKARGAHALPGLAALTLDRLPKTLRNIVISEMRGSDMTIVYHGHDMSGRMGTTLEDASYWDLIRDEDAPRWFTAIRLMLETPCGLEGKLITHHGDRHLASGILVLPFRPEPGDVQRFLTVSVALGDAPAGPASPRPWLEIAEIDAIDIGFGLPATSV